VSLTNLERSHFFHTLRTKVKNILPKVYRCSTLASVSARPNRQSGPISDQAALIFAPGRGNACDQWSPPVTAEAQESLAALVQAYFLVEAWVSESVWACV
jgi:hypothetical protein